jgi:glycosyltransferase involved in cell wall biosynthesis
LQWGRVGFYTVRMSRPGGLPRVAIVAQNASLKFGGEAALPWLCFKALRQKGVDCHLIAHGRTGPELFAAFPDDRDRIHLAPETRIDRLLWRIGSFFAGNIDSRTFVIARHILNQTHQRRIVRSLIADKKIDIVHELNPVSPKQVSLMHDLGVPVVIGPLAGGTTYPPGFFYLEPRGTRALEAFGLALAKILNRLFAGKRKAEGLIVANESSRASLPAGVRGKIYTIPDVGLDPSIWNQTAQEPRQSDGKIRFVYLGRLADWKGVQFLLDAFKIVAGQNDTAVLEILGDGDQRKVLEAQANQLGLTAKINFAGWVSPQEASRRLRECDVFVLPSLHEVGGIVLLEAMAVGLPVVCTDWGGPASHVSNDAGIKVKPQTPQQFVQGLAEAMSKLADSPEIRRQMGEAGRKRVRENLYDWNQKADRLLQIYAELIDARGSGRESKSAEV